MDLRGGMAFNVVGVPANTEGQWALSVIFGLKWITFMIFPTHDTVAVRMKFQKIVTGYGSDDHKETSGTGDMQKSCFSIASYCSRWRFDYARDYIFITSSLMENPELKAVDYKINNEFMKPLISCTR